MTPVVSVIMPVFNTGAYLQEAIDSVLNQVAVDGTAPPPCELVIVDDHSDDAATLAVLAAARGHPNIQVHVNTRGKGAAGARNTGIDHARGEWIGFLDSDDIWFPTALALRWRALAAHSDVSWIGARFRLLKPAPNANTNTSTSAGAATGAARFPTAAALIAELPIADAPSATRMVRPMAAFADSCFIGIMTVLIRRELIVAQGLFDESLRRAEDYHLWFKCALGHDLLMLDAPIAFYRIHSASLTHGHAPLLLHEDEMIELLLADPRTQAHQGLLWGRYDRVMQDHCYFYRRDRAFATARLRALRWLSRRPRAGAAWKELLAALLRRA